MCIINGIEDLSSMSVDESRPESRSDSGLECTVYYVQYHSFNLMSEHILVKVFNTCVVYRYCRCEIIQLPY